MKETAHISDLPISPPRRLTVQPAENLILARRCMPGSPTAGATVHVLVIILKKIIQPCNVPLDLLPHSTYIYSRDWRREGLLLDPVVRLTLCDLARAGRDGTASFFSAAAKSFLRS